MSGCAMVSGWTDELAAEAARVPCVVLVYVFGSHARGRARRESDVDVAVLVDAAHAPTGPELLKLLLRRLTLVIPSDKLDLVVLNGASPLLRFQVLKHGRLVYVRHPRDRVRFTIAALRDYHDTEARRRAEARIRLGRLKRDRDHHGGSRDFLAAARRAQRVLAEAQGIPAR